MHNERCFEQEFCFYMSRFFLSVAVLQHLDKLQRNSFQIISESQSTTNKKRIWVYTAKARYVSITLR